MKHLILTIAAILTLLTAAQAAQKVPLQVLLDGTSPTPSNLFWTNIQIGAGLTITRLANGAIQIASTASGTNALARTNGVTVGTFGTLSISNGSNTTVWASLAGSVLTLQINTSGSSGGLTNVVDLAGNAVTNKGDTLVGGNIYSRSNATFGGPVKADTFAFQFDSDHIIYGDGTGLHVFSFNASEDAIFIPVNSSEVQILHGMVSAHILPVASNTYDLGSGVKYWRKLYVNAIDLGGSSITAWPSGSVVSVMTNGVSVAVTATNLNLMPGTNVVFNATNDNGNVTVRVSVVPAAAVVPSIPIMTNGVSVTSAATNINFIAGTNVTFEMTNDNGNVTLKINGPSYTLITNNPASSLTNFVVTFTGPLNYNVVVATNDLNFMQTTGRLDGVWQSAVTKVYAGPTNRQVWLNSSWTRLGQTTNYFLLSSNKVLILSVGQDGSSETNVAAVTAVQP